MTDEHDPFNEPDQAHPKARELMTEKFFWDCVNEMAPFGSDEGWDAYYEYRNWRSDNPNNNLIDCIRWILQDNFDYYNETLLDEEIIKEHYNNPNLGGFGMYSDMFTLDTTIIATALGQLIDEGKIDQEAKPFAEIAAIRQGHPSVADPESQLIMKAVRRVLKKA
jgi:uncharacterized protein YfeS